MKFFDNLSNSNYFVRKAKNKKIKDSFKVIEVDEYKKESLFKAYSEILAANKNKIPFTVLDQNSSKEYKNYIYDITKNLKLIQGCCVVFFTSGSSGRPKAIQKTNKQIFEMIKSEIKALDLNKKTIFTNSLPLSWCVGLYNFFWYCYLGADYKYIDKTKGYEFIVDQLIKNNINFYPSLSYHWREICKILEKKDLYLDLVADVNSSSIDKKTIDILIKRTKGVYRSYGTTESTAFINKISLKGAKKNSVGKAVDDTVIKILDSNNCEVSDCEVGEIQLSGSQVSSSVLVPYKTGDLGYLDEDGDLFVVGRKDEQFKVASYRLNPDIIEEKYNKYNTLAFGVSSYYKDWSEVVLVVESNDSSEALINYINSQEPPLTPYSKPRWVFKADNFYKTKTNKIDRFKIKKEIGILINNINKLNIINKLKQQKTILGCNVLISKNFLGWRSYKIYYKSKIKESEKKLIKFLFNNESFFSPVMLPLYFYQVDRLSNNNKTLRYNTFKPKNSNEERLLKIFKDLLNKEKKIISTEDDIVSLGMNSLKVYELANKINSEFKINLSISEIFQNSNIKKLSNFIKKNKERKEVDIINSNRKKTYFPLAPQQKRIWAYCQMQPGLTLFNVPIAFLIKGRLNITALQKALEEVISRHRIFRVNFVISKNNVFQKISNKKIKFKVFNLKGEKGSVDKKIRELLEIPFNLEKDDLLRAYIIKKNNKNFIFFNIHHLIVDVWSKFIFQKDFFDEYETILNNKSKKNITLKSGFDFLDYSQWIYDSDKYKKKIKRQKDYWENYLKDGINYLDSFFDKPIFTKKKLQNINSISASLNQNITKDLKSLANDFGVTFFVLLFFIYFIFIHKISEEDDICIGLPVSNRDFLGGKELIGFFLNTILVKWNFNKDNYLKDSLLEFNKKFLEILKYKDYPFDELVRNFSNESFFVNSPLVNMLFQFIENGDNKKNYNLFTVEDHWYLKGDTEFNLSLKVVEKDDSLLLQLSYNKEVFKRSTIEKYFKFLKTLITDISNEPDKLISHFSIVPNNDIKIIFEELNNTYNDYPNQKNIINLFEESVNKNPKKIAVSCNNKNLTYIELNSYVNRFSNLLKKKGVNKGDRIAVLLSKSEFTLVTFLSILKLGGVYIPLSGNQPQSRLRKIIKDANPSTLITTGSFPFDLNFKKLKLLKIDKEKNNILKESEKFNSKLEFNQESVIIYTSGSTGTPKGVTLNHKGIINHIYSKINVLNVTKKDIIAQNLPCVFVASIWQFLVTLITGGRVVIYDQIKSGDPQKLFNYFEKDKISIAAVTPSFLRLFLEFNKDKRLKFKFLKKLIITGEELTVDLVNDFYRLYDNVKLFNAYGQAECSDDVLHYELEKKIGYKNIPLGKPINNTEIYIMDKKNRLKPVGISGEICVAGDCLSEGYLNKSKLNYSKFVSHPIIKDRKIFKTGDIGRLNQNNEIEFLGRFDNQIKINGSKVELDELEKYFKSFSSIKNCIVTLKEYKKNKHLVVYYMSDKEVDSKKIINSLKKKFPYYMIPYYYIKLDKFPYTPSGKLDKLKLPSIESVDTIFKPTVEEEKISKITAIWKDVLGVNNIFKDSNFFELGGDSIKAIIMLNKVKDKFKKNIPVKDFFLNSNLFELVKLINKK